MKYLLLLSLVIFSPRAYAFHVLDQNIFDQLQGTWAPDFREKRTQAFGDFVKAANPDLVVFEEAKGVLPGAQGGGTDSVDAASFEAAYPFYHYVHEMTGDDGGSYGYWIGSKQAPDQWIEDHFFFPGGVDRRVIGALFKNAGDGACLGILAVHLSYQTSEVRQTEADWLLAWVKSHESLCSRWLVTGDFNADETSPEMKKVFAGGLNSLYSEIKPSISPSNPIRGIYNEAKPSLIDWALGWNLPRATARIVNDAPYEGQWISDHATVDIEIDSGESPLK